MGVLENGDPTVLFFTAAQTGKLDDSFNVQIPRKNSTS